MTLDLVKGRIEIRMSFQPKMDGRNFYAAYFLMGKHIATGRGQNYHIALADLERIVERIND